MVPKSWGVRKISEYFGVSYSLANTAFQLHENEGIRSSPDAYKGHPLSQELKQLVENFYYNPDISRILPGKKDYLSVVKNEVRTHVQKRLLLDNLNEVYALFQDKHQECKISLTKFSTLRPKECVLAGSNSTHFVCVCKIHQNVKLMIDGPELKKLSKAED